MENKAILKLLQSLGLSELEQQCYLVLLQKSPQRASEIAKRLDVPKATVLLALSRLSDKLAIISRSKKKNSYEFSVDDPRDLVTLLNRRASEITEQRRAIESLLPELRSMQQFDATKPQITYYEGKEGMKQVFLQVLEEADGIIGYGSNEDDVKYLPNVYPDYYEKRVAKKIFVRAIISATQFNIAETLKHEIKHQRRTHLIPKEFNYPIQVNIYKHTTVFFSFEENFALVIKSKPITDCLKKIFEFAFEYTERLDKEIREEIK